MASCFSLLYVLGFCVMFHLKGLFPIANNLKTTALQHT